MSDVLIVFEHFGNPSILHTEKLELCTELCEERMKLHYGRLRHISLQSAISNENAGDPKFDFNGSRKCTYWYHTYGRFLQILKEEKERCNI